MDDAVANRMRARVQEGARSVEVWEVVRTFRVYVETDDGRAGMVTVQVQQSDAGWMVLAHGPPDGREVGA